MELTSRTWSTGPDRADSHPTEAVSFVIPGEGQAEADRLRRVRDQSGRPFEDPCPIASWPDLPTHVVAARDDRLFPFEFQRAVARERLGLDARAIPGGHLLALSQPRAVADVLLRLGQ